MTLRVLQKVRDSLWPAGTQNGKATQPPYFNDSEIGLLKLRLRENSAAAVDVQKKRGHAVNPRIAAARAAGAKV